MEETNIGRQEVVKYTKKYPISGCRKIDFLTTTGCQRLDQFYDYQVESIELLLIDDKHAYDSPII